MAKLELIFLSFIPSLVETRKVSALHPELVAACRAHLCNKALGYTKGKKYYPEIGPHPYREGLNLFSFGPFLWPSKPGLLCKVVCFECIPCHKNPLPMLAKRQSGYWVTVTLLICFYGDCNYFWSVPYESCLFSDFVQLQVYPPALAAGTRAE